MSTFTSTSTIPPLVETATHYSHPAELLNYLPAYGVVICTTCKYAIQPSAIARHLKDIHHIHRSHKRPFLEYVSKLDLKPPETVISTRITEFPILGLPVQDGLACRSCQHLCVSKKRMKSHMTAVHGRHGQVDVDWYEMPLQTFFRGNLLRYFTKPNTLLSPISLERRSPNFNVSNTENRPLYNPQSVKGLNELDKLLFHHYVNSTSWSIAHSNTEHMWQATVLELASQHPFLLHGILAVAALHLAHNQLANNDLVIRASHHQSIAMPLFRTAISNPTKENCDACVAYTHLLVIYSFAAEQQDERLFLVEPDGPDLMPCWLFFVRGGCSMLFSVWDTIESGPVKNLACAWDTPIIVTEDRNTPLIQYLLSIVPLEGSADAWSEQVCQKYREAATQLGYAFQCAHALGEAFTTWDCLRIWPLLLSTDYILLLNSHHPSALILLAHYCIVLHKLDSHWYLEGRAKRLLLAVTRFLEPKWQCYIKWPLEDIV